MILGPTALIEWCDQMASAGDIHGDPPAGQLTARHGLDAELREIAEQLRVLVDAYQECPGELDRCILDINTYALDVETTIIGIYHIVMNHVYAEDSPLRADNEVWEAFSGQKDEFLGFYKAALNALETYKTVLHAYSLLNDSRSQPRRGDLERIGRDKRALVKERDLCIEALTHFQGKFSGMLTIFQ